MKIKMSIFSLMVFFAGVAGANTPANTYVQKEAAEQIVQQMFQSHAQSMNCACNTQGQTMCCTFMGTSHCYPDSNCPK